MRRTPASGAVVKKSGLIQPDDGKVAIVKYGKLVHGCFPVMCGPAPVGRDVAQCQPDQLGSSLVGGEVAARLDDLA